MTISKVFVQKLKTCFFLALTLTSNQILSQSSTESKNAISLSAPLMYNSTTILNVYGSSREISGSAISVGVRICYDRLLTKDLFLKIGAGLFTQAFGIRRPFEDFYPPDLGMTTKYYKYSSIELIIGGGYTHKINTTTDLEVSLTYNPLLAFKETYTPTNSAFAPTVTHNRYHLSHNINTTINLNKKISQKISLQYGLIAPLLTKWRKDERFKENTSEFYKPKFHIGITFGVKYKF